ncbi:chromosome segregation protein SMC [Geobacter sp. AOG1]|uniref:chromosome segregation protein SMC n=1 Tax=Geobacter sp. AOG1 TaxID=1566346 RepID=UPI001CC4DEEA|nr:chromosome segregation protein SMC [Geobacter sp. AOG1]GFE57846.1 chromosome partition protein Smc [Geobacter sp. AOG1]
MRIKRLEILGFKSFVEKVSFDFTEGITAIVGPNGCGKSNVVDAIRWVMGEQSAKNLRGRQMEDVIFGGSEFRKPLGMAEVSLVFSTEDGRVPARYLDYSEIQVTRRLYRDGTSEYYLNKTPCRLLDISELFMDTGVGARAYSIIEQGRIGMILLAKPEERRFLIEEAAGVTKFKSRKQVALKKIEATRQNLLRIGDIVAEIRRQLNSLQRQAKKAEKFREYREELKEIDLRGAVRQYLTVTDEKERLAGELAELNTAVAALAQQLERGELALEERRIALLEEEKTLTAAQEEIFRAKGEMQACENRLEFQRKEQLNLDRHRERFAGELESLAKQLFEAEAELKMLGDRKGAFASELADEEQTLQDKERELEEFTAAEGKLAAQQEESRRELFSVLSQVAQQSNIQGGAAKRLEALDERFERSRREDAMLREKLAEASRHVEELGLSLQVLATSKASLVDEQARLKVREEELKLRLNRLDDDLQSARNDLSSKGSRLHSLQELEAQFAGYGQGVRSLFLSELFKGRFDGVVADFLETDEECEAALEAVLGDRLQCVLGGGEPAVGDAIVHLQETGGGRCSFLLGGADGTPVGPVPRTMPRLLDRVRIADQCKELIAPLLIGIHLAPDRATAIEQTRRYPHLTFVTLSGDVAANGGVVTGGALEAVTQGLVHKKREIKGLSVEVEHLGTRVLELEGEREQLRREIAAVEEGERNLRQRLHQAEINLLNAEKDLQRVREDQQRIEERLTIRGMEDGQLAEERAALERELVSAGEQRATLEARKVVLEEELAAVQETLVARRQEIEGARERVTAMKVRSAALREKRESNFRAIRRVEELGRDLQGRISSHEEELNKCVVDRERMAESIGASEKSLQQFLARQLEAEAAHTAVREKYEAESVVVQEDEAGLKGVRSRHEASRQAQADANLKFSELTMGVQHLENSLHDRYRLTMVELLPLHRDAEFDVAEDQRRQAELQRLVDEMGEVNLTAIDDYRELEERFSFLSTQKKDLEESLHGLQQAIQRINRTTRKRFLETFQQVNAKFQEVFPRLFCGGRAELRLTNEEDLLETGIDIIVQPPGKKLQNVTLLSGGEKALTAVALIFSIFLIKPSPFCLLDEVDAPLDDANIGRFNDMVREMTAFAQFIMITHSKTTMAVADTLYGVTMEEPGISKLVSVKLN